MTDDLKELLGSLRSHNVDFLVVGSIALSVHGRARYTEDLDLWLRRSVDNVRRLEAALKDFGLPLVDGALNAFVEKDRQMIVLGAAPQAVDLLNFLGGVSFEDAWERRITRSLWGIELDFIGREDFIESKKAAGRSKDLADLALLAEVEGGGSE